MASEKNLSTLTINYLTQTQFNELTTKQADEIYLTPDAGITSTEIIAALGYTPYNSDNPNEYTSNNGTVTEITAGTGLNTTSNDTTTDGGSVTTSGTLYLTKSGVTPGSYGPSSNAEPTYGATFNVPYITVDKYGRVTGISTKTVKIPASDNRTYESVTGKPTSNLTPSFGGTATISQISQSTTGQITATDRTITIPSTIATYNTIGLIKPWYSHTKASTGPTTGSNATAVTVNAISTTSGKYYAIESDSDGRLFVNVPWSNSTYSTANSATTGITASTTANKVTVSSSSTDYGVTAAGSGSFTQGSFNGGSGSFSATVTSHVLSFSHTHTAATHGTDSHTHTAPTLGSKVPTVSSTSATVTISDPGHTHTLS